MQADRTKCGHTQVFAIRLFQLKSISMQGFQR